MANWKPIATAPKDGTKIKVWVSAGNPFPTFARYNNESYAKNPKPYWDLECYRHSTLSCRLLSEDVTHWDYCDEGPQ